MNIIAAAVHHFTEVPASTVEAGAEGASTSMAMVSTIKYPTGDTYTGQVDSNAQRNGKGILKWANGDIYDGRWLADMAHGKGKYTWADGREYDGPWFNNLMHGNGILKLEDGNGYGGEWSNNKLHGKNKLKYLNITIYDGMWKGQPYLCIWHFHYLEVLHVLGILMGLWIERFDYVGLLIVLKGMWTFNCQM